MDWTQILINWAKEIKSFTRETNFSNLSQLKKSITQLTLVKTIHGTKVHFLNKRSSFEINTANLI